MCLNRQASQLTDVFRAGLPNASLLLVVPMGQAWRLLAFGGVESNEGLKATPTAVSLRLGTQADHCESFIFTLAAVPDQEQQADF